MFWVFMSVLVASGLSFIAVMAWLGQRRKEREQYYQTEMMKKIAESGSAGPAIEYLRERDRLAHTQSRGSLKLAGLVLMAAGVGIFIMLAGLSDGPQSGLPGGAPFVGVVPLLIGLVLFGYGWRGVPKD